MYREADPLFKQMLGSKERQSRRNRECWACGELIKKGEKYQAHAYRYDKRMWEVGFHLHCYLEKTEV